MIKNIKYLLAIAFLVFTFNNIVNAQKKLERIDSCFTISNEVGIQKIPAQKFIYEINRNKYPLISFNVLIETEIEFRNYMIKNRKETIDSLIALIDFNKNSIITFIVHGTGCKLPSANMFFYKNRNIVEVTIHGGCEPKLVTSSFAIINKKLYSTLTKTYFCTKYENK
jgi:hypothetical protein